MELAFLMLQGKAYGGLSRGRHVDLGDGYDTEDSFIDNEEAVSSVVVVNRVNGFTFFFV